MADLNYSDNYGYVPDAADHRAPITHDSIHITEMIHKIKKGDNVNTSPFNMIE